MSTEEARSDEVLVRDIMTTPVVTATPTMPLKELVELFRANGIGGVPVVEENGDLVGIVTEGDLMATDADLSLPHYVEILDSIIYLGGVKRFENQVRKAAAATVADLMTPAPMTVKPDDEARKAATLMARHGFDRVPVEEGGKVVGIVSRHDILRILEF